MENQEATTESAVAVEPAVTVPPPAEPSAENAVETTTGRKQVYLVYDERMTRHHPVDWKSCKKWPTNRNEVPRGYTYENPERILRIYQQLLNLDDRPGGGAFDFLPCQPASRETILLAHSATFYDELERTCTLSEVELEEKSLVDEDVCYNQDTFLAATLACGGVVSCVDAVTDPATELTRAIADVRPPGHHACEAKAMGFCYFNNVAVAAKHAIATGRAERVAIIDWDVHHGNGTQDLTFNDPNIMYISLHRFGDDGAYFFPGTGKPDEVADGTNVNIAWTQGEMGNVEYAAAFSELILPLLAEWSPNLILVSCGFDAAKDDLIGDCNLTPDMCYSMTKSLLAVGGYDIPVVVALEGGYNLEVISACMEAVALALLDVPLDAESELLPGSLEGAVDVEERLEAARNTLFQFWNHSESNVESRGPIKPIAARCLSETMEALERAPLWVERAMTLRRLVEGTSPE